MKKILFYILIFIFSVFVPFASANNLSITNVSLEDRDAVNNTVIVEFDISWDNSWRNEVNYDAIWMVLKVAIGSATPVHGILDDDGVDPLGTSTGSNNDLEILVPTDNRSDSTGYLGAFIYRNSSGTGTVMSTNARLKLDYTLTGASDTNNITVNVIGIEMVYIPEAPFFAGDTNSTAAFKKGSSSGHPWYIESENTVRTTTTTSGSFYYTSTGSEGGFANNVIFTLPLQYPKGYGAFYCMKYPVTEGQWVDFINSVDSASKTTRDITSSTASGKNSDSVIKRNTIGQTTNVSTNRPDRAVSYLNWMDLAAYLDWVALRPMSELEFEKVARGPLAVVGNEYAWGSSTITAGVTFSGSPEDGNETFTTAGANANYNSTTFSQGDDYLGPQHAQGPVRPGIFATSLSTRSSAGAGHYGVMDLSGNLNEMVASAGNTTGASFYAVHGDGVLSTFPQKEGNASQLGWPGTVADSGLYVGVETAAGSGLRGGSWNQASGASRTSDRSESSTAVSTRSNRYGGRGVRSVSPPAMPTCGSPFTLEPPEQCDGATLGSCTACLICACNDQIPPG